MDAERILFKALERFLLSSAGGKTEFVQSDYGRFSGNVAKGFLDKNGNKSSNN